jgi:UTP--glucose-1-phosphate uridylyltransferase
MNLKFAPFVAKMRAAGLSPLTIDVFSYYYAQLTGGETGLIPNTIARPIANIPSAEDLDERFAAYGLGAIEKAVVIKLNGGLGTSMGLDAPKSLLPVKNSLSFLDITVRQVMGLRQRYGVQAPLLMMNSFTTDAPTLQALACYPEFKQDLPLTFLQNQTPKIWKADLSPASWPADPDKEWCPPGHGDLYTTIYSNRLLDRMIEAGYEFAFISNSDNLGATLDPKILGYLAIQRIPFLMEVAQRTVADRKGGHLARRFDGQLLLRESAQCPLDELAEFQDIERYRYFNTNNLWINLHILREVLNERKGVLGLPLIRNEKPVDPTDPSSPRVYQLETAMGSAIAVFSGAQAICVPRSRFIPVKKNSDLLALWSDAYRLDEQYHLVLEEKRRSKPPIVTLDDEYYGLLNEMMMRFPYGAPSMIDCNELEIVGDVRFGRNVVLRGRVSILHRSQRPYIVSDGTVFEG